MADYYTDEHIRVAAILRVQLNRVEARDDTAMLLKTKWAREAINGITIDLAVMYREKDPEFDFPRFLREVRQGVQ